MPPEKAAIQEGEPSTTIPPQAPTAQESLNLRSSAASSSDGATIIVPRTDDFTETNSTSAGSRLGHPFSLNEKLQEYQNSSGIESRGSCGTENAGAVETAAETGVAPDAITEPHAVAPEGQQEGLSQKRKAIIVLALCVWDSTFLVFVCSFFFCGGVELD